VDNFVVHIDGLIFLNEYGDDMQRVWETERPFELALDGVIVSGRADVILEKTPGESDSLSIVDYKTSIDDRELGLQLQVYTVAGLREGLEIRGAYVHDLDAQNRIPVDISEGCLEQAMEVVTEAAQKIKDRQFDANQSL